MLCRAMVSLTTMFVVLVSPLAAQENEIDVQQLQRLLSALEKKLAAAESVAQDPRVTQLNGYSPRESPGFWATQEQHYPVSHT